MCQGEEGNRDKSARKGGRPDVKKRGCSAVH